MARPTKATDPRLVQLCAALRTGMSRSAAADLVGIDRTTLGRWMGTKPAVRERVLVAEAQLEFGCVDDIRKAGADDWRADAYLLEHRFPDRWGRRAAVAATADGTSDTHPLDDLAPAEQARRLRVLADGLDGATSKGRLN